MRAIPVHTHSKASGGLFLSRLWIVFVPYHEFLVEHLNDFAIVLETTRLAADIIAPQLTDIKLMGLDMESWAGFPYKFGNVIGIQKRLAKIGQPGPQVQIESSLTLQN